MITVLFCYSVSVRVFFSVSLSMRVRAVVRCAWSGWVSAGGQRQRKEVFPLCFSCFFRALRRGVFRSLMTDVCRYGSSCWRPLCPYVHACGCTCARKWAGLWASLAAVEDEESFQNRTAELVRTSERAQNRKMEQAAGTVALVPHKHGGCR